WAVGQEVTTGAVWSSTVMVWLHETEFPQRSDAVQVRRVRSTAGQLQGTVSSLKVTVRWSSQLSENAGSPNTGRTRHSELGPEEPPRAPGSAGHWIVWSVGHETTTGAVRSSTVRVWLQVAELPQSSVAVHVRRVLLTAGQLQGTVSSLKVTVRFSEQWSENTGSPNVGRMRHSVAARPPERASPDAVKAGHWMVWLAGHE